MKSVVTILRLLPVVLAAAVASSPARGGEPFSFGIIADIQYADKADRGARHYRESLGNLEECVRVLNGKNLAFTIQLGDIIDGNTTSERTLGDLDRVLQAYNKLSMPKFHVVGNHCLTAGKAVLRRKLGIDRFYYAFTVPGAQGWRFIVLDGNDAGYGVLGEGQLKWLGQRLEEAGTAGEKVIVFNHFGLLRDAALHHRMAAPDPVLDLLRNSRCVVAYIAGHDHAGGYTVENGVHHITVKGMVEAPARNAYAVIEVHATRLEEIGFGSEPSRRMVFSKRQDAACESRELAPPPEGNAVRG